MKQKSNNPIQIRKAKRDEKIWKLFQKYMPSYGRTGAYRKIEAKGLAEYTTVIKIVKRIEAERAASETVNTL